jgi:hypothetical protein
VLDASTIKRICRVEFYHRKRSADTTLSPLDFLSWLAESGQRTIFIPDAVMHEVFSIHVIDWKTYPMDCSQAHHSDEKPFAEWLNQQPYHNVDTLDSLIAVEQDTLVSGVCTISKPDKHSAITGNMPSHLLATIWRDAGDFAIVTLSQALGNAGKRILAITDDLSLIHAIRGTRDLNHCKLLNGMNLISGILEI